MAITFTSHRSGSPSITIGGDDTSPFPSYSISRQDNYAGDDTYLNTDYSITVNGVVVVDGDPTIGGQLHSATHAAAIDKLSINSIYPTLGFGELKIAGYDGTELVFDDARIKSVQTPVSQSGGFRYQEYTITFEATDMDGSSDFPSIQEVGEQWEFSINDGQFAIDQHNPLGTVYKTFTLTHTITATGRQSAANAVEAWRQAVLWVESRLISKPNNEAVKTHINTSTDGPKFVPFYMNTELDKDQLKTNADAIDVEWEAYNAKREISTDISSGNYSVTDTWLIAIAGVPATHTVEFKNSGGQDEAVAISLNGTITGLSTVMPGSSDFNKPGNFSNAEAGWNGIKNYIGAFGAYAYGQINGMFQQGNNGSFRPVPISRSLSENRAEGTITWSTVFSDKWLDGDKNKIAEQDISVQYKNEKQDEEVFAVIPVIGREEGPVIQRFRTKNHRVVTVTVAMTMTTGYKNEVEARSEAEKVADKYEPPNGYLNQFDYEYVDDYGIITLTKEWFYK